MMHATVFKFFKMMKNMKDVIYVCKLKKVSMIEFNSDNLEDLEEEAKIRAIEVSLAIVEGICNGLDQGADVIALGFMKAQNLDIMKKKEN